MSDKIDIVGEVGEAWARAIVRIRDESLEVADSALAEARVQEQISAAVAGGGTALDVVVPEVVDCVILQLLHAIDHKTLRLALMDEQGNAHDLYTISDDFCGGSMVGSFLAEWLKAYATGRVVDRYPGVDWNAELAKIVGPKEK